MREGTPRPANEASCAACQRRNSARLIGMRTALRVAILLAATTATAQGQWQMQTSNSNADLRGIDSVGGGVAWASGTHGTVLRTEDGGYMWQSCSMPPGAEKLDFRGIQAFDANTALVMSSGPGDQSRLYKTTDGCHSWKLMFSNPDAPDGFFDALILNRFDKHGALLGDPVKAQFALWTTSDRGDTWQRSSSPGRNSHKDEGAFAASNSSLLLEERFVIGFVTGGPAGPRVFTNKEESENEPFQASRLPMKGGSAAAGAFSIAARDQCCWIAVGGDYSRPDQTDGSAAYTLDGGKSWHAAQAMPHGYRSSVAFDASAKTWIAVGPNGTDISTDDGKHWRPLKPDSALHEPQDADRNWNAISLPYVVGPHGRIGRLDEPALRP